MFTLNPDSFGWTDAPEIPDTDTDMEPPLTEGVVARPTVSAEPRASRMENVMTSPVWKKSFVGSTMVRLPASWFSPVLARPGALVAAKVALAEVPIWFASLVVAGVPAGAIIDIESLTETMLLPVAAVESTDKFRFVTVKTPGNAPLLADVIVTRAMSFSVPELLAMAASELEEAARRVVGEPVHHVGSEHPFDGWLPYSGHAVRKGQQEFADAHVVESEALD